MRTQIQNPGTVSHAIQGQTKAANQAGVHRVLQKYAVLQRAEMVDEEELLQGKFKTVQRKADVTGEQAPVQRMAWVISRDLNLGMSGSSNSGSSSSRAQDANQQRGSSHGSSDSSNGASISGVALSSAVLPTVGSDASSGSSSERGSKATTSGGFLNAAPAKVAPQEEVNRLLAPQNDIRELDLGARAADGAFKKIVNLKFHHRHILFDNQHLLPLTAGDANTNNIGYGGVLYSENSLSGYERNNQITADAHEDALLIQTMNKPEYKNYGPYRLLTHNCQHWVNDVVGDFQQVRGNAAAVAHEEIGD